MRKFLLWWATMCVGGATFILGLTIPSGDAGTVAAGIAMWSFALAFGLALSAPAFLDPPDDNGGVWSFRLPLVLWLFLIMMKLMSWIGFYVLLGCWTLIFRFWAARNSGRRPTFSGGPQQQPAYQPYAPSRTPPSWQTDPTGRYMRRYWDGTRWTDHVANGSAQAVDPL